MDEDYSNYLDWLNQQGGGGLLGASDAAPATQALPDPNALYAQMQAQGTPTDYTAFKAGVTPDNMSAAGKTFANNFNTQFPDSVITSTTDGQHAPRSMHGTGDAIDVRTAGMSDQQLADQIRYARQQGATQVGYEGNHLHLGVGNNGGGAAFGPDKTAMSIGQAPPLVRAELRAMQNGQPLNQANPYVATQAGVNQGSVGTPSGPAPAVGTVQGPNLPGNNPGNVDQAGRIPDPSRPATPDPTTTGPTGSAGQGGQAGKGKGDTNQDQMQKLAKAIMGFGALGAKGPYHFAPPASGGSPVNRPDVASPDSYKAGARILPKIQLKGILG